MITKVTLGGRDLQEGKDYKLNHKGDEISFLTEKNINMKFIPIDKARGLEIDQPVFTKDSEGNFGYGRLIKEEKTIKGIVRTFQLARFEPKIIIKITDSGKLETENPTGNYSKISEQTNITHVCVPK